jgi:NAD(P)-dependent dehydrogenase (short-subunit alcohol dehydrogenase family)
MTYYGSQMVVQNYNIMGVARAALEATVRYIAAEVGPKGIRVHAISPGPLATRAASGIPEFDELMDKAQSKAPTRSLVSIDDVGAATAFLRSMAPSSLPAASCIWTAAITSSIDAGNDLQGPKGVRAAKSGPWKARSAENRANRFADGQITPVIRR